MYSYNLHVLWYSVPPLFVMWLATHNHISDLLGASSSVTQSPLKDLIIISVDSATKIVTHPLNMIQHKPPVYIKNACHFCPSNSVCHVVCVPPTSPSSPMTMTFLIDQRRQLGECLLVCLWRVVNISLSRCRQSTTKAIGRMHPNCWTTHQPHVLHSLEQFPPFLPNFLGFIFL